VVYDPTSKYSSTYVNNQAKSFVLTEYIQKRTTLGKNMYFVLDVNKFLGFTFQLQFSIYYNMSMDLYIKYYIK
jgi:hypothetical protein